MSHEEDNRAKHVILDETKKLAVELLKNPEFAEKALRDRNIIIRGLKADIEHRKVAFKEIVSRYDEVADSVQALKNEKEELSKDLIATTQNLRNLEIKYQEKIDILGKTKDELAIEKHYNDSVWVVRLEKATAGLEGWKGGIFRILFSRPISQYVFLSLFCLLFVASLIGWPGIAALIQPLYHLFHGA